MNITILYFFYSLIYQFVYGCGEPPIFFFKQFKQTFYFRLFVVYQKSCKNGTEGSLTLLSFSPLVLTSYSTVVHLAQLGN